MRRLLLAAVVCAAMACGPALRGGQAPEGDPRAATLVDQAAAELAARAAPGAQEEEGWLPDGYVLTLARDGSWTLEAAVETTKEIELPLLGNQAPPASWVPIPVLPLFPSLLPAARTAPLPPVTAPAPPAPSGGKAPMVVIRTNGPAAITMDAILATAKRLVGVPYVWGGNSDAGLDCSAYVSKAWGVGRHTTDTIHTVAFRIPKDELLPGDILNLTIREDPRGYGHVRLFAGWANAQQTRMWVYEETPPRSLYHAIPYDPSYTPMRRVNYVPDGDAAAALQAALAARRRLRPDHQARVVAAGARPGAPRRERTIRRAA